MPRPRSVRKNIDYLRPEECEAIEAVLRADPPSLSTRDVAIGALMYHTGMRASDVAGLLLTSIDWERETVSTRQSKTGAPLVLPLLASFGNAICDYLANGRPESGDPHLFLSERRPHGPIGSACVRGAARCLYAAAGIRTGKGDHRGSHLMRHNAATTMVDSGVSRAVASAVLGHTSPESIDSYLFADIEGLRTCALDVSVFPVADGVFA